MISLALPLLGLLQLRSAAGAATVTTTTTTTTSAAAAAAAAPRGPLSPSTANFEFTAFCEWKVIDTKDYSKNKVPDLGHLRELDTSLSAQDPHGMHTRFDLINARKSTKGIKFDPGSSCRLSGLHKIEGPYEFDLDLLIDSGFDLSQRTIIMIPGYRSHEEDDWIVEARQHWLELVPEANIIQVSWTDSNRVFYERAVANTVLVARQVVIFLHYLAELSGSSLRDEQFLAKVHIIGHSLGAHIAGFVGQDLAGRLGRITGLDPAGPKFDYFKPEQRLDPSDARLVDVIHTNRGTMKYMNFMLTAPIEVLNQLPLVNNLGKVVGRSYNGEADTSWFGIDKNIGHLDYNANSGKVQPGCEGLFHICDHRRAKEIYNDLLRHEVQLRKLLNIHIGTQPGSPSSDRLLKAGRFFAHKADNFIDFNNGHSLVKIANFAQEGRRVSPIEFNLTSVPLDLVTPVEELIEELEIYHGVKIKGATNPNPNGYFFKTCDDSATIGDHWIIRLQVQQQGTKWDDEKCALSANFELVASKDVKSISIDVHKLQNSMAKNSFIGLPFIHPDDPVSRIQMFKLVGMVERNEHTRDDNKEFFENTLQHLLPDKITFSINKPKTPNFVGAVRDTALKFIKLDPQESRCQLAISRIEMQLIGEKTINAVYNLDQDNQTSDFFVISTSDYHKKLLTEEENPNADRPMSPFLLKAQNTLKPSFAGVHILT